jgi:hypothetical protein
LSFDEFYISLSCRGFFMSATLPDPVKYLTWYNTTLQYHFLCLNELVWFFFSLQSNWAYCLSISPWTQFILLALTVFAPSQDWSHHPAWQYTSFEYQGSPYCTAMYLIFYANFKFNSLLHSTIPIVYINA